MLTVFWLLAVIVGFFALAYVNAAGWAWTVAIGAALAAAWAMHAIPLLAVLILAVAAILLAIPLNVPVLRRKLISDGILSVFRKVLPPMSQTERDAIEAGTVWWDGELFSGRPDWSKLLAMPGPKLSPEEQRFLDRECDELCAMVSDWETTQVYRDLPAHAWQYVKDKGFLGMIIPKRYGGLGFSAYAHSQVITKLSTHSGTVAVTVMVPNSLGPGELLLHYGTDEQKNHYLPRLAKGIDIPCFALTNPHAGSDAAAIPDTGIVCMGEYQGKQTLGLKISWEKRYITLGPVATLLSKLAVRATGGYARIRRQFKTPIGKFEGVEEALTRMGGNLYMMDATRALTALAVDLGEKPAVLSGIAKYHLTERGRQIITDAMDVAGGKGICMGPSNFLGAAYMQMPVSITVEGANILTRSLIIFGQGAIRCHPYVLREIEATRETDIERASAGFDQALFGHIGFVLSNMARSFIMGLCGSHCVPVPRDVAPETRRYYQQLTRFSAALAFLSDISMGSLGGALKRKEKLSARLGDILSLLYLCSATLKRYELEGRQAADAPLMHWSIWDAMFKAQNAIEGVLANFPNRMIAALLRTLVFPLGRPYVVPSDSLGQSVARLLIGPSASRDRLTAGMHISTSEDNPVGAIELAMAAAIAAEPIEEKIRDAVKDARFYVTSGEDPAAAARAADVITAEEMSVLARARRLSDLVIRVDDFPPDLGASEIRPTDAVRSHKAAA